MEDSSRDLAFHCGGWAYDTGRQNRRRRLVIRISRASPTHSRRAAQTLSELESRYQQEWSEDELDVTDVSLNELALVVGELLPWEMMGYLPTPRHKLSRTDRFDPAQHILVETQARTGIIVKLLNQPKATLYLLHHRLDRFRGVSHLPSSDPGIFYYEEWTENVDNPYTNERKREFQNNIRVYANSYLQEDIDDFIAPDVSSTGGQSREDDGEDQITLRDLSPARETNDEGQDDRSMTNTSFISDVRQESEPFAFSAEESETLRFEGTQKGLSRILSRAHLDGGDAAEEIFKPVRAVSIALLSSSHSLRQPRFASDAVDDGLARHIVEALAKMPSLQSVTLALSSFSPNQIDRFCDLLEEVGKWNSVSSLELSADAAIVNAILRRCDVNNIRAVHLANWTDRQQYRAIRDFRGSEGLALASVLERLYLDNNRADGFLESRPPFFDWSGLDVITKDFPKLEWLVISDSHHAVPEHYKLKVEDQDHVEAVLRRMAHIVCRAGLKKFAFTFSERRLSPGFVRGNSRPESTELGNDEIFKWYESVIQRVMMLAPRLHQFAMLGEPLSYYCGTRNRDDEINVSEWSIAGQVESCEFPLGLGGDI